MPSPKLSLGAPQGADALTPPRAATGESADALAAILDALPDVVFRHDRDGRVLFVNHAVLAATGYPPEYYLGHRGPDVNPNPVVAEQFETARQAVFSTGKPATFVVRRESAAGVRWAEYRVVPEVGPGGEVDTVLSLGRDVTDREEAVLALEAERRRLMDAQRIARLGSWQWDVITGESRASEGFVRLLGLEQARTDPLGAFRRLLTPEDAQRLAARVEEIDTKRLTETEAQWNIVRPDGERRVVHMRSIWDYDGEGRRVRGMGTFQDVTEEVLAEEALRASQEQVRQAQKMEALGLLAGSVAHDFNNLLSAIIGGAELARLDVPEGSQAAQDLDDVRQAATRASQLTRQLLAFSRKQVLRPRVLDLRDALRDAEPLLRRLLPEEVALDLAWDGRPCVVRADAGQLEQVLMNLVVNARDAVAATGRRGLVTVEATRLTLVARDARLTRGTDAPLPPGEYPAFVVRDTGVGMDAATLSHAFEPFFTTKALGKGTGLGLATVFGIVAQNGGAVTVRSAPGAGATFTVLLPAEDAPLDAVELGAAVPPVGTETVLLVEDEAMVRETATRILERHGYRVIATRHGGDALLAWAEHGAAVDVVVTDLRMPEMGGRTLLARLRAERPSLPFVVMSGYSSGKDPDESSLLAREVFLTKPFTTQTLLVQIRSALDRTKKE